MVSPSSSTLKGQRQSLTVCHSSNQPKDVHPLCQGVPEHVKVGQWGRTSNNVPQSRKKFEPGVLQGGYYMELGMIKPQGCKESMVSEENSKGEMKCPLDRRMSRNLPKLRRWRGHSVRQQWYLQGTKNQKHFTTAQIKLRLEKMGRGS